MAVFPPQEVREALFRAARDLPSGNDFRLVGQERIHLTLKFLGDVTEDELDRSTQALEHLSGRHEPFEVSTSGFGAFPSERRARILWAGIEAGAGLLRGVAQDVEDLLEPAGRNQAVDLVREEAVAELVARVERDPDAGERRSRGSR